MARAVTTLARRLARACPGWALREDSAGYWLTPPDGDVALVTTEAALLAWLSHQERWSGVEDEDEPLTFGSVYAGIGGIDLGLERAGMQCLWQVEIDDYKRRILAQHWPNVLRRPDVAECDQSNLPAVDVLAGGFMCTDITSAGLGAGLEGDTRSGFTWRHMARLIRDLRPRYVLVENAAELLHRGMGQVLGTLSALGFDAEWSIVSACSLGAPHARERVFIVAYANQEYGQAGVGAVAHGPQPIFGGNDRPSLSAWLEAAPRVPRMAHGVPYRVDRTEGLGDAVSPVVAEYIGRAIVAHAQEHHHAAA